MFANLDSSGYTHGQQDSRPFRLIPDDVPRQTIVSPVYLHHVPTMTPFILFPEEYEPVYRDVQIVMRSGMVAQPPPIDRPFAGIDARDEIQREDDEILHQLRTTQARISIWSLLASFSTQRDALIRALSHIRVDTATIPRGLIHFLTADRATCIVFSDDDLPPEGSDYVRPLFIDVACSVVGCRPSCWTTAPPLTFVHWLLPLLWDFHHPILGHPYKPLELMTRLRG